MIENINFRMLNIDKYLTEIANTYYNIGQICNLPFYERLSNELALKEYTRNSRRLAKGILTPPTDKLTKSEIESKNNYEQQINVLKNALHKVPFLDWFSPDKLNTKKKYGLIFDRDELENFKPNTDSVYTWIVGIVPMMLDVSIDEIKTDFISSPLPIIDYYKNKLTKLKSEDFIYLDLILNGALIEKLDNNKICSTFCFEVVKIKEIQYLENKIFELENPQIEAQTLETSTNTLTQKQIALLFKCLFELDVFTKSIINTDHTKQTKLIALMVGISIPDKPNNWNFYKYWNSIQSINDDKQILTIPNLEIVLNIAKTIDFKELEDNIKQKIKELK